MEQSGLTLHEVFRSQSEEQRKECFQKEFERYIVDSIEKAPPEPSRE